MSHPAQRSFIQTVKDRFPGKFQNGRVLEVGSLDINGSVRQFFTGCDYLGIDVGEGHGVDLICKGEEYSGDDNSFDVTISCECFEHNPNWIDCFRNMFRMTKSGGLIIMTCAAPGRPEHGTSRSEPSSSPLTIRIGWEYYRNLNEADFRNEFNIEQMFSKFEFSENHVAKDLYFWGIKK